MTSPDPGLTYPNPRTWSAGDIMTTPRLRGDMTNFGYLFAAKGRPILLSINNQGTAISTSTTVLLPLGFQVPLNTWSVNVLNSAGTNPYYQIPFAGYYLAQVDLTCAVTDNAAATFYAVGFDAVINGAAAVNTDGGVTSPSTSTSFGSGGMGTELFQMNTYADTLDTLACYVFTTDAVPNSTAQVATMFEWVGLPTSGLTNYTGPYGTVVSGGTPVAAAQFPSGPGTTQTAGTTPGATFISVADNTGIVVGGTLGLGYINGVGLPAGSTGAGVAPETVTVTSVAGPSIGISATAYGHASGDPVAVPVSAAFLNQQSRDLIRFLSYPPMLRAVTNGVQVIGTNNLVGTQITNMVSTIDTFSGFASNTYTIPVSGVYLVYGQVYLAGVNAVWTYGAGISVSGGTVQWGTTSRFNSGAVRALCPTVQRYLRLTAGQTITLQVYQNSGGNMNTVVSSPNHLSKLICVWRSF